MSIAELEAAQLQLEQATGGLWREAWYRLTRNVGAIVGATIVAVFAIGGILQPQPPGGDHLLGLDIQGRDVFSRIVYGARYTLLIGVVSVGIGLSVGLVLGAMAGYVGGILDSIVMRL